ncbi:hypothetical protein ACQR5W_08395 [Xanthomonas sacchari]|nr:hypothetical protein [Xanthomonas sp. SHU 308]
MWQRIKEWWQARKARQQNKRILNQIKEKLDAAPEGKKGKGL